MKPAEAFPSFAAAPLFHAALAWAGGILLHRAGFSPSPGEAAFAALTLAGLAALAAWRGRSAVGLAAALAAFVLLSASWSPDGGRRGESPLSIGALAERENLLHQTVTLEGRLSAMPVYAPFGTTLDVDASRLSLWDSANRTRKTFEPLAGTVRVRVEGSPWRLRRLLPFGTGDHVRLKTTLRHFRSYRNAGGFDYAEYLRERGVELRGETRSAYAVERVTEARGVMRFVQKARRAAEDALIRHFPGGNVLLDPAGGMLLAFSTGERTYLDPEDARRFKDTGVFHIIAISGLQMMMLGFGVFYAVRPFGFGPRAGALFAACAVAFYAVFADPNSSVFRAAVMAGVFFLGRTFSRRTDSLNLLGLAALVLLAVNPRELFDVGFQLTFAATLALIVLARLWPSGKPSLARRIVFALGITAAAQAVTAPIILQTFHSASPLGLLLNLWVVPLSGVLMQTLLAFLLVAPWSEAAALPLEALLRAVMDVMSWPVNLAAEHAAGLAAVRLPAAAPWKVFLYYALLVVATLLSGIRGQGLGISKKEEESNSSPTNPYPLTPNPLAALRRAAWAAWALSALLLVVPLPPAPGESLRVHVLDVGQGQSVLAEFPGRFTMLADGGGARGRRFDVGENVVTPFLLARGVRRLDVVAVTAPRADHAYGVERVLRNFPVNELWLPWGSGGAPTLQEVQRIAKERGVSVVWARAGRSLEVGGARHAGGRASVEVLAPLDECRRKDAFLALSLRFAGRAILLPSDIRGSEEDCLAAIYWEALRHDALLLPMHGSASASGGAFLDAVSPRLALVSVGSNPWGWPSEDALRRLGERKIPVLRTDLDGQISVEIFPDGRWRAETPGRR